MAFVVSQGNAYIEFDVILSNTSNSTFIGQNYCTTCRGFIGFVLALDVYEDIRFGSEHFNVVFCSSQIKTQVQEKNRNFFNVFLPCKMGFIVWTKKRTVQKWTYDRTVSPSYYGIVEACRSQLKPRAHSLNSLLWMFESHFYHSSREKFFLKTIKELNGI